LEEEKRFLEEPMIRARGLAAKSEMESAPDKDIPSHYY
jgi:hypothetical protein